MTAKARIELAHQAVFDAIRSCAVAEDQMVLATAELIVSEDAAALAAVTTAFDQIRRLRRRTCRAATYIQDAALIEILA